MIVWENPRRSAVLKILSPARLAPPKTHATFKVTEITFLPCCVARSSCLIMSACLQWHWRKNNQIARYSWWDRVESDHRPLLFAHVFILLLQTQTWTRVLSFCLHNIQYLRALSHSGWAINRSQTLHPPQRKAANTEPHIWIPIILQRDRRHGTKWSLWCCGGSVEQSRMNWQRYGGTLCQHFSFNKEHVLPPLTANLEKLYWFTSDWLL